MHAILATCLSGRTCRYSFAALPGLSRLFDAAPRHSEDAMYQKSLLLEPRGLSLAELEKREAAAVQADAKAAAAASHAAAAAASAAAASAVACSSMASSAAVDSPRGVKAPPTATAAVASASASSATPTDATSHGLARGGSRSHATGKGTALEREDEPGNWKDAMDIGGCPATSVPPLPKPVAPPAAAPQAAGAAPASAATLAQAPAKRTSL